MQLWQQARSAWIKGYGQAFAVPADASMIALLPTLAVWPTLGNAEDAVFEMISALLDQNAGEADNARGRL